METDAALVMDIKTGNKNALGTLVERHKRLAFRLALGLVGNKDDAYDISQEAFLRVYRSAETYDSGQPFLPWFYTIISNLCRTWLRRRTNRDNKMVDVEEIIFQACKWTLLSSAFMILSPVIAALAVVALATNKQCFWSSWDVLKSPSSITH